MKTRGTLLIAAFCLLVSLHAAEPKFEFSGVLTNDGETKIALTNQATGATTWVEPGEKYLGYTVERYDSKEDAVFLKKDGAETRLSLIAAKTPAATASAASSPAAEAAANAIRANLRALAAAARRYQLDHPGTSVTYADLVGPDKIIRELKPVAGENYANLAFGSAASALTVSMTDGTLVSVDLPPPAASTATAVASQSAPPAAATTPAVSASPPVTPASPSPQTATTVVAVPVPVPPQSSPPPSPAAVPSEPVPSADNAISQPEALEPTGRPADTPSSYMTGANETWESVARKNGVTVDKLKDLNPTVISPSSLPEGRPLRIR